MTITRIGDQRSSQEYVQQAARYERLADRVKDPNLRANFIAMADYARKAATRAN